MLKLLELCKTRAKKSSPDMFNFYVVLIGQDKVTDIAGLPRAGATSKPQYFEQKVQKMKDIPKNVGFDRKTV